MKLLRKEVMKDYEGMSPLETAVTITVQIGLTVAIAYVGNKIAARLLDRQLTKKNAPVEQ